MVQERFLLFKVRSFGDVINDALAFGKRYFSQYGYAILTMVMPAFLVGSFVYASALSTYSLGAGAALSNLKSIGVTGIIAYLILVIGSALLHLVFIVTFMAVERSEDGHIDHAMITSGVRQYWGRMLVLTGLFFFTFIIVGGVIALLIYALMSIAAYALIFLLVFALIILMVYILVRLSFVSIIYVREELSFTGSISRAFFLTKGNFWWTFLVIFIASVIGYMIAIVFTAPYMAVMFTKSITMVQTGRMDFQMSILDKVAMAIGQFGTIALSALIFIAVNMQYYSLVEKKDGISVLQQIENIGAADNEVNHIGRESS